MKTFDRAALGMKIKQCREEMGLTQEEAAELCGISASYYGNIERGTKTMSIATLLSISAAFSVSFEYLLSDSIEREDRAIVNIIEEAKRSGTVQFKKYLKVIGALAVVADRL